MEDTANKEQSSASGKSTTRLLRYPLRSASRTKEEKPPVAESINSHSATKRGRPASSVAKSMGNLDLSGKDKPAKPPRRLSVPSKYNSSTPAPKSLANITPISEARSKRSAVNQGKRDSPLSDVSKTSIIKKFSTISSASYWLTQIKCSESAAMHSISLGFFKLALDAGCKPVQKMRDELKAYVRRHNLSELGESIKELFESYKITESYETSEASGAPPEPNQLSDDDVNSSSSSITDAVKLKTKSVDVNSDEIQQVKQSSDEIQQVEQSGDETQQEKQSGDETQQDKQSVDETQQDKQSSKEIINKKDASAKKTKRSVSKNAAGSKPGSEVRGRSLQRKPQKPSKKESAPDNVDKAKKQGKKSAPGKVAGPPNSPPNEVLQDNKENMVEPQVEEITAEA